MKNWRIAALDYGWEDDNNGAGLTATLPYLGFYLTNDKYKVLVDNGISDDFVEEEIRTWNFPCKGGAEYVLKELDRVKVKPDDIDIVVYTHFHFDHVGNCHLFPKATHLFQDAEWKEMVDPLPSMQELKVFDREMIPKLEKLKCQRLSGDVELLEGLKLLLTPGHSAGSQSLQVSTKDGTYIIAGDLFHCNFLAYPEINTWKDYHSGNEIAFTAELKTWLRRLLWSIVYDHYSWFRSQYRIRPLLRGREFLLGGHEPSILGKTFG
jgi:N-acyl homoserine lactone hydrolase